MNNETKSENTVTLHCELNFNDFIDPFEIKEIIDSHTFCGGKWREKTNLQNFSNGTSKIVFPVDISKFKFQVLTKVAPNTKIPSHNHPEEPMFRYIVDGSLMLNGRFYKAGDWVVVPTGQAYEISTDTGYMALHPYCMSCEGHDDGQ